MAGIVVVGSINIDLVARVPAFPREGETVSGRSFSMFPGGKGANQAVCAARLGGQVQMIGRLGDDMFGTELRSGLERFGVQTEGVRTIPGSSGTATIIVSDAGANSIVVVPGANAEMTANALEAHVAEVEAASILLTQMETPLATAERLADLAQEFGIPLMLDPAPAQHASGKLLRGVTWLTPNETEMSALLGMSHEHHWSDADLLQAAERLLQLGPRNVVLKLGDRGVLLVGEDTPTTRLHAFQVQAVDTTAAGDAFNGAFAVALTEHGMLPPDAARFACAAAAVSVTRPGAQPAMPTSDEVEALLKGA